MYAQPSSPVLAILSEVVLLALAPLSGSPHFSTTVNLVPGGSAAFSASTGSKQRTQTTSQRQSAPSQDDDDEVEAAGVGSHRGAAPSTAAAVGMCSIRCAQRMHSRQLAYKLVAP